jgi:Predicted nucleic-acid-binding protein containing a Zn-ribbon
MSSGPRHYSPYDAPMWESIGQRRMTLQQCECGSFRYPPGPACPDCGSLRYAWVPLSGRARLLSWTIFHRQYLPAYPAPTLVVAAQLEEGPIMVANMDVSIAAELALDRPLVMAYADHPDGYVIPVFRLSAPAGAATAAA